MKKILTMIIALAAILSVLPATAAIDSSFTSAIVVDAAATNATSASIDLSFADAYVPFRDVDEVSFLNGSTGAVTVTFSTVNMDGAVAIATLTDIAAGAIGRAYPRREQLAQTISGYVVTGDVAIAKTTYVTNLVPYKVRNATLTYTLPPQGKAITNWYQIKALR